MNENEQLLPREVLHEIHEALVSAGIAPESIIGGLPSAVRTSLPSAPTLGERLLSILNSLNAMELESGSSPLYCVLQDAQALATSRKEALVFRRALRLLEAKAHQKGYRKRPQAPPARTSPLSIPISKGRLILASIALLTITVWFWYAHSGLDHYDFYGQLWDESAAHPSVGARVLLVAPGCKGADTVTDATGSFEFHCALQSNTPITLPRIRVQLPGRPSYCADAIPLIVGRRTVIRIDEYCHARVVEPAQERAPTLATLAIGLQHPDARVAVVTNDGVELTSRSARECGNVQLDGYFLCAVDVPLGRQRLRVGTGVQNARTVVWIGDVEVDVKSKNGEYWAEVEVPAEGLRVDVAAQIGARSRTLEIQMNHSDAQARLWNVSGAEHAWQSRDCSTSREGYQTCSVSLPIGIYTIRFSEVFGFKRKIAMRHGASGEWSPIDTDAVFINLTWGRGHIFLRADYNNPTVFSGVNEK